jgi:ABC-type antimicrobial peptide transport system permease subunit
MIVFYSTTPQYLSLRLNPANNISASLEKMRAELKQLNPAFPPDIAFVADNVAKKYENEQVLGVIANIFGGLAIFLSCLGLLGLSAFAAEQRTKEIGVRKVLGARVWGLTALLSREFLLLVLISFLVATPISWWAMNNWLNKFDYHTTLSLWVFVLAGLSVLFISIITVGIQGVRAASANPVKSLRTE